MNTPTPVSDMMKYFKACNEPVTEANIRRAAKMLSMTETELALALTLARPETPRD